MFIYRPSKNACWGHSLGRDEAKANEKMEAFLDVYFEHAESDNPRAVIVFWRAGVLPKTDWPVDWPDKPENPRVQLLAGRHLLFTRNGNHVGFPLGLLLPISPTELASYQFLHRFSSDAPFKMNPGNFKVGVVSKKGTFAWRKPDAGILAHLEESIGTRPRQSHKSDCQPAPPAYSEPGTGPKK